MVVEGNLRCITTNDKITCGWNEPIGTTQEDNDEIRAKAKAKADAEAEAEARAKADAEAEAEAEAEAAEEAAKAIHAAHALQMKAFEKATADAKKNREILEEKIRDITRNSVLNPRLIEKNDGRGASENPETVNRETVTQKQCQVPSLYEKATATPS